MTATTTTARIDPQTQEELMRQAGIWIEHSTLIEDDLPARPLAAVQAEKHQLDRYTQLVADRAAARDSKCLAQIEEPAQHTRIVLDDRWKARMLDGRAPERDEMGLGDHPELPMLDEGMMPRSFFAALGLELAHTSAEDQLDWDVLGAMSEAVNWADWLPTPPQGDGWKLVSIFDTEDGPVAWWLRELPEAEDGTTTIRILQAEVEKLKARIARAGAASAAVSPQGVAAWMTPEGDRVVTAETMDGARKDGGASLSSLRPYTVALVRAGEPAAAAPALEAPAAPAVPAGYVAPKGRYVPPVLFSPYTGEPRDARDIASDPQGVLIVPPGADLLAAAPQAPRLGEDALHLLRRLLSNQHTLTGPEFRAELEKIVAEESARHAAAPQALPSAPDWWRKRADEIKVQVAATGNSEAMRCYTDMRTLLQSAAAPQAPNCTRCSGSGEDPEGYLTHGRGPDDHTVDGPCRGCDGTGSVPQAPAAPAVDAPEPASEWRDIFTAERSDDLIWLYDANSKTIDGPRIFGTYDVEEYTHWAPAEAPDLDGVDEAFAAEAKEGGEAA